MFFYTPTIDEVTLTYPFRMYSNKVLDVSPQVLLLSHHMHVKKESHISTMVQ